MDFPTVAFCSGLSGIGCCPVDLRLRSIVLSPVIAVVSPFFLSDYFVLDCDGCQVEHILLMGS